MYVESKRLEYLDSIRGVAALFVLLSHTVAAFAWPKGFDTFLNLPFVSILFSGQEAVCMFFVLSGYVLSKPYFRSPGNPSPRTIFLHLAAVVFCLCPQHHRQEILVLPAGNRAAGFQLAGAVLARSDDRRRFLPPMRVPVA